MTWPQRNLHIARRLSPARTGVGTMRNMGAPRTLFDKIWADHEVGDGLLFVDLHLVHEVTSPQAFEGLRLAGRRVRRPDLTLATMDHNVPTLDGPVTDPLARAQLEALRANCEQFGIPL